MPVKISQTKGMCPANRLIIIKHILNGKQISRVHISEETRLNKATVSAIIRERMSLKLVEEIITGDSNGGRPLIILTLAARVGYCVAVDIGARRISLTLTDLNSDIISRWFLFIEKKVFSYVYQ